jgi:ElaB/YqjD/DUF883 family membrane-anchored ribosome-binding protein
MRYDRQRTPAEIEAEILRARADMDATLTEIESRLTAGALFDQSVDYLRHSGAHEFVSNLGASVKQNPLSIVLVGVGLSWLMLSGRNPARGIGAASDEERYGVESAGDALDRVSAAAGSARERAAKTTQTAAEKLTDAASTVRDRARRAIEDGRRQARRARRGYEHLLREQPFTLGAIGLAVGAVIAAALPRTRQEDEWMGEARDRLAEKAGEAAAEELEHTRRMATPAGDAATDEAARTQHTATP